MLLKKAPAYRKAEKEDFSIIREFIRRNYKDRWEFEETHTEKHLTRLFFYTYMIYRDSVTVATYRERISWPFCPGFPFEKRLSFPAPEVY